MLNKSDQQTDKFFRLIILHKMRAVFHDHMQLALGTRHCALPDFLTARANRVFIAKGGHERLIPFGPKLCHHTLVFAQLARHKKRKCPRTGQMRLINKWRGISSKLSIRKRTVRRRLEERLYVKI